MEIDPVSSLRHYRLLGRSGLRVSPICLGTMNFGSNWDDWMAKMVQEDADKILDFYCDNGGNFIDTACNYQDGQSEQWIGDWLKKRGNRDEMVIATKYSLHTKEYVTNMGGNHRKNMFYQIDQSLKRLQTHYVDILYVHYWDFTTPVDEIMRGLDDLIRTGKVHYVAISDAPAWQVSRANMMAELRGWSQFIAYQGKYHIGERDMEREIFPMCKELNMAVVPWGVLGQGKFSGKFKKGQTGKPDDTYRSVKMTEKDFEISEEVSKIAEEVKRTPAQVVMNWTLNRPYAPVPIAGIRNVSQLEDNVKALEFQLTKEQIERLDKVSKFELGFPHNFIGQSYQTNPWVKWGGILV